jgi:SAM-dependent methyltransferase
MSELGEIYRRRFGGDIEFRNRMWKVLAAYFQRHIPPDSTVLEVAAGYCEFINNINAKRKIALDMNPDAKKFANADVEVIVSSSTDMKQIGGGTIDAVFMSNFLEHLEREDIKKTVREIHRILRKGGKLLILQPNYRFCHKDYFMFFDHVTPLDDRSLTEVLELNGFRTEEVKERFLPYTTKGSMPKSVFFLKIYLRIPILQRLIGKQALVRAERV